MLVSMVAKRCAYRCQWQREHGALCFGSLLNGACTAGTRIAEAADHTVCRLFLSPYACSRECQEEENLELAAANAELQRLLEEAQAKADAARAAAAEAEAEAEAMRRHVEEQRQRLEQQLLAQREQQRQEQQRLEQQQLQPQQQQQQHVLGRMEVEAVEDSARRALDRAADARRLSDMWQVSKIDASGGTAAG